jgi:hypothetical protein
MLQDNQKIVHTSGKSSKFVSADKLFILFFTNGILIPGFKFKNYRSSEGTHILSDLLDG